MVVNITKYPTHRWYHNFLHKVFGYKNEQAIYVQIDEWDTWSMDHTLAMIIHPMLIQLHDSGQGYHAVDQEDAPHITFFDSKYSEEAWSYVLGEMIWAFEQKADCSVMELFMLTKDEKRMKNGFRLFGKYYENLWT